MGTEGALAGKDPVQEQVQRDEDGGKDSGAGQIFRQQVVFLTMIQRDKVSVIFSHFKKIVKWDSLQLSLMTLIEGVGLAGVIDLSYWHATTKT